MEINNLKVGETYRTTLSEVETGEIIHTHVFKQQRSIPSYDKKYQKNELDPRRFFNVKLDKWVELSALKPSQLGHLIYLATFMNYKNICCKNETGGFPLTKHDIQELSGKTLRSVEMSLNELESANLIEYTEIIHRGKQKKAIKLNAKYFYRGKHADNGKNRTAKGFVETLRQIYKENSAASVGFIARLLNHIDKQTNFLCSNPARNYLYEDLVALSLTDIAAITQITDKTARKHLRETTYSSYSVFCTVKTNSGNKIKMNPAVFCRLSGAVMDTVMQDFTAEGRK
ncbi:hypothetical protein [Enterococcus sp. AZ072]|uniref:hypothetical protein n=1 Tax=unclassified Enterococcus TaxID=2608891 RepID=UPI003D2A6DA6